MTLGLNDDDSMTDDYDDIKEDNNGESLLIYDSYPILGHCTAPFDGESTGFPSKFSCPHIVIATRYF